MLQLVRIILSHLIIIKSYILINMSASFKCLEHPEEPLDMVCLDHKCEHKGIICFICKLQAHLDHESIVPLKQFLSQIIDQNLIDQNIIKQSALIDQQFLQIKTSFLKLKNKIGNYESVMAALCNFWKGFTKDVILFDLIINDLKQILKKKKDGEYIVQLNKWIVKNGVKYSLIKEEETKDGIYINFLKSKFQKMEGILNQIAKIEKKVQFEDRELLELFNQQEETFVSFKLKFSEELKGACMTISAPNKASMTVHGNQRMILLEPNLGATRKIKRWKVKIQKLASWIGVGVAHLASIKGVNFDFSYTAANHGNYLISSNGYSWNGYKMQFNSKYEPFQYTTNDIVEITYDPVKNKISFRKQGNEAIFSYDVDPQQKPIHAAINMTGVGDAVEILY